MGPPIPEAPVRTRCGRGTPTEAPGGGIRGAGGNRATSGGTYRGHKVSPGRAVGSPVASARAGTAGAAEQHRACSRVTWVCAADVAPGGARYSSDQEYPG